MYVTRNFSFFDAIKPCRFLRVLLVVVVVVAASGFLSARPHSKEHAGRSRRDRVGKHTPSHWCSRDTSQNTTNTNKRNDLLKKKCKRENTAGSDRTKFNAHAPTFDQRRLKVCH